MRDRQLYLKDILAAMVAIEEFIGEIGFETFSADDKTASAVIRKLEIIGEATKNVPAEIRQNYPQVPWTQMAGMRDRLIHATLGLTIHWFGRPLRVRFRCSNRSLHRFLKSWKRR